MTNQIFRLPTAQPDLEDKAGLERRDEEGPKFNEREQQRIAREQIDPHSANRLPVERKPS